MARDIRLITWNGKDLPPAFRDLPVGRYLVEPADYAAPLLSPDEEAGIEAALESYRQGRIVDTNRVRKIIDASLARRSPRDFT